MQLQSVFTRRNVKLRRANVSAAANTTEHDSIARPAGTRCGLRATGTATARLTFLYQDAIASYASRSFRQRGGSGVDWLGTDAPYRCCPV
jgi:hypothetical protein